MSIPSQMLKGTLEACILRLIDRKESYGYELVEQLKQRGLKTISEGTLYPILLRLEKNGLITARYKESPVGPKRKYFRLSLAGEEELLLFQQHWAALGTLVESIFKEDEHET